MSYSECIDNWSLYNMMKISHQDICFGHVFNGSMVWTNTVRVFEKEDVMSSTTQKHYVNGQQVAEVTTNERSDGSSEAFVKETRPGSLGTTVKEVVAVISTDKYGNTHTDDRK